MPVLDCGTPRPRSHVTTKSLTTEWACGFISRRCYATQGIGIRPRVRVFNSVRQEETELLECPYWDLPELMARLFDLSNWCSALIRFFWLGSLRMKILLTQLNSNSKAEKVKIYLGPLAKKTQLQKTIKQKWKENKKDLQNCKLKNTQQEVIFPLSKLKCLNYSKRNLLLLVENIAVAYVKRRSKHCIYQ